MSSSSMKKNWVRGESLGSGSAATVNIAIPTNPSTHNFPSPTAVKSSLFLTSYSLKTEKDVLDILGPSPNIIKCYGNDCTVENGKRYYNVFLEYAAGGSLADQLKKYGGRFPEACARQCTKSILEGLKHIHSKGYVHCDVKPQNILVFDNGVVKIADLGLAKRRGEINREYVCRGTPMYMSPESLTDNVYESPVDIWALGCTIVEMITGEHAWYVGSCENTWTLMNRIGIGEELPKIPQELSQQGKDFLGKCLVKDPNKRWTAHMLLNHPFIKNPLPQPLPRKTDRPACMPKGIPCTHQAKMGEGKDFLDKCPGKDPKKGLTAEMPLNHPFMHTKRCSVKRVQKLEAELNKLESEAELSGLKINFAKSRFGAFGISDQWKHDAAKYLNCSCLTLLFVYLGIPIGAINATKCFLREVQGQSIQQQQIDIWEWIGDSSGIYTTRSAYNLIWEEIAGGQKED
ncbi:mitogen-activated protein kinase kinase kinase 18-like [Glycine soja]|uniref:mitogen-activated protein kinase kinase kinase 18-like n=1 Tax=Glycine soja TaxID=3848 RepID=UPI00103ACFC1|nr:mitogen-activated protein kinase kinase kinase 18-like [Glycine soja]